MEKCKKVNEEIIITNIENENQIEIYRIDFLDKENEELLKQEK